MKRVCVNAIRTAYNFIPSTITVLSKSPDGKNIIFIADGKTYTFNSESNPNRYSKRQWKEMKTWSIEERKNGKDN